jgi:hypothetical protein
MLSEAIQIFGFVRFVAQRIGSALKWLSPRQDKLPRNRRVITITEFDISRARLHFRSYRLEECGLAAVTRGTELPLPIYQTGIPVTDIETGLPATNFEAEAITQERL